MAPALHLFSPMSTPTLSSEELRIHTETDAEKIGTRADEDTARNADEDPESAEERRRSAYRLT